MCPVNPKVGFSAHNWFTFGLIELQKSTSTSPTHIIASVFDQMHPQKMPPEARRHFQNIGKERNTTLNWLFTKKLAVSRSQAYRPPRGQPTKGQTYLLDCLIIQIVLERRAMCSSIAAETRKLSSASASFLISAAKARIAS